MRNLSHLMLTLFLTILFFHTVSAASIINGEYASFAPGPNDDLKVTCSVDDYYERLTDYANGYSLLVPQRMTVDASLSPVVTVLTSNTLRIEIFHDNFSGTATTVNDYMAYSKKFLANTRDHTLLAEETYRLNGFTVHLLSWARHKLRHVPNDKNYYASIELAKDTNEVYTVMIKSTQPIENAAEIADSFRLTERRGTPRFNLPVSQGHTPFNSETRAFYDKFFSPASPLRFGIFEPGAPQTFEKLDLLESQLTYTFPVLVRYQSFDENLPVMGLQAAYERGRTVELTLQTAYNFTDNSSAIYDILDGKYDEYFNRYATQLKAFGHPVLFRLNNEMNGDWCWYSAHYYSKDAELYKAMWRYIRTIFDQNDVDNVIWVWNPHDLSFPDFKWNHYLMYYPGDEYVDVIGLTGYNTGNYFLGEKWRDFSSIYPSIYREYDQHFAKPFMITEFGSNSVGGDKPAWIRQMFDQIGPLNKIKIAVWWNGIDYDQQGQPGRIYLLDETEETLAAFRQGLTKFTRR
ncbi:glycoside hydrolase family 26 protein [Sporomusa acidovorans]|uniref:GH26 domain-containing protein n=1 Tax=Sporomusa acidovorans (strain ATCC 49682 / DSM 3132 / Mol) TaxID=1123286 RepID=A0ABZ3IW46_SPOA4|nr:glycosyl hydrolase [Sporomusa acidovorans]OZC23595.1 endoglucanase H precursor [Sporomusa acidovorans DSM 3132]SDE21970.1 Glycosyl hydrolase family 26 [Sporomusa acidovorans]